MCTDNTNKNAASDHASEPHEHDHAHTHEHEHCGHHHMHTHADGTTHSHGHTHSHATASSPEEALALLKYMLDHNIHHAKELSDLADRLTGEAQHQLMHAVEAFDQGNGYLAAALEHMK